MNRRQGIEKPEPDPIAPNANTISPLRATKAIPNRTPTPRSAWARRAISSSPNTPFWMNREPPVKG